MAAPAEAAAVLWIERVFAHPDEGFPLVRMMVCDVAERVAALTVPDLLAAVAGPFEHGATEALLMLLAVATLGTRATAQFVLLVVLAAQ
jgi:hypothetical protein